MKTKKVSKLTTEKAKLDKDWVSDELRKSELKDVRLKRRLEQLTSSMWNSFGRTIPNACEDWSNTKAAYRFLSNSKVNEQQIWFCRIC